MGLFFSHQLFADLCPDGTYKVRSHPRSSYYRTDGVFVSNSVVEEYCKNYRSDGPHELIFNEKAPKRYPVKNEKFKKCTQSNTNQIAEIFSKLNKVLTSVGKIDIYCSERSIIHANNPASSFIEQKSIILYDLAFNANLEKIISHELAHFLWENLSDIEKNTYYETAEWREIKELKLYITKRSHFTASDGKTSPEEDFANNVEAFLYDRKNFDNNFIKISNLINIILGGANGK